LENQHFIEDVLEYFRSKVTQDKLQLLFNDKAWEKLVADVNLTRDEADVLRKALDKLTIGKAMEDKEKFEKERDTFLKAFPGLKMELESSIQKLHMLADKVDKIHKDCTISNVVASTTGVCSALMSTAGLMMAPETGGLSLGLTAAGLGLGIASAVTNVSTNIVDDTSKLNAKVEATKLMSTGINQIREILKVGGGSTRQVFSLTKQCEQDLEAMAKHIRALRMYNSHLVDDFRNIVTTGTSMRETINELQEALEGTVITMTRGARILGGVTLGINLLLDGISLAETSVHLYEGAKEESADELRKLAQEMERQLEELTQIHQLLQADREMLVLSVQLARLPVDYLGLETE
ncbi:PREDICTED: apolipoprotein L3, partial [Chrysochloris asiatica]|uniref:Apolipoprotein L3 n=1 Tax=Chrysochloris asiatica TaxID=185453 RepID=A0A9B0TK54_CHRAS